MIYQFSPFNQDGSNLQSSSLPYNVENPAPRPFARNVCVVELLVCRGDIM